MSKRSQRGKKAAAEAEADPSGDDIVAEIEIDSEPEVELAAENSDSDSKPKSKSKRKPAAATKKGKAAAAAKPRAARGKKAAPPAEPVAMDEKEDSIPDAIAVGSAGSSGSGSGGASAAAPAPVPEMPKQLVVAGPKAAPISRIPPGQRLLIKCITLYNFKSYAGLHTLGPFHSNFTSIVGPNGSGKSNVIDSLLFVFGKRATNMRLKKLSELIHKSADHPNLRSCRVTVHFCLAAEQKDGSSVPVPKSDFSVTREASLDGGSDYYLNPKDYEDPTDKKAKANALGKKAKLDEVTTELGSYGIDLVNNRFLILQGEVEHIAMMPPKAKPGHDTGLLEYLEEIIGSIRFAESIEEQGKRVEQITEVRAEYINRTKIAEKERDALAGPKAEAIECVRQTLELNQHRSSLVQFNIYEAEQKVKGHDAAFKERQTEFETKHAEHNAKAKEMESTEAEYNDKKTEFEATQREMTNARETNDSAERKLIANKEDAKHNKDKTKKLNEKLKQAEKSIADMKSGSIECEHSIPRLEKELESNTKQKEKLEKQIEVETESLRAKTGDLTTELAATNKQLIPKKKVVNKAAAAVTEIKNEIAALDESVENGEKNVAEAKAELADTHKLLASKKADYKSGEGELHQRVTDLAHGKAEQKTADTNFDTCSKRREETYRVREDARASSEAVKGRDKLYAGLMSEKKAGRLPGFIGRLGELGTIDDKYDAAVTTACHALRSYVVTDVATAQAGISFLKAKALGQAEFIVLGQLADYKSVMAPIETPESAPRLFDLIKVKDAAVAPAFYKGMQNTLVATDIDQAMRISNVGGKRWRVVTLAGQLIETVGTMSGGGKPQRGGMSSKAVSTSADGAVDEKTLKSMDRDCEMAEQSFSQAKQQKEHWTTQIPQLTRKVTSCEQQLKKLGVEIKGITERLAALEQRVSVAEADAAKANSKELKAKRAELTRQLKGAEQELAVANKATEELESKLAEINNKLMAAGGAKLKALHSKLAELETAIDEASTGMQKARVTIDANRKKITKTESSISSIKDELVECAKRLEELVAETKEIERSSVEVVAAFEAANAAQKQKFGELTVIQKKYDALKKAIAAIKEQEVDITNQMETEDRAKKDAQKLVKGGRKQLDELIKQIEEGATFLLADEEEENGQPQPPVAAAASAASAAPVAGASSDAAAAAAAAEAPQAVDEKGEPVAGAAPRSSAKGYKALTSEELANFDRKEVVRAMTYLEQQLKSMKPNMSAIEEYAKKNKEYATRVEALDKVTADRDVARKAYDSLRKQRLDEFMGGFSVISLKLKEMYQMLTLGGDAELELVDTLDPFSEGIAFSVRPPKKSWKHIQNLSGGEKTLSSLALVFALHHYRPTPLYCMDEIDAALDFKNVSIVANYIKERTKNAQFIVISLRNNMFELADRLVGIYKTANQTKSITIDPRKFALPAAAAPPPHPLDEKRAPLNASNAQNIKLVAADNKPESKFDAVVKPSVAAASSAKPIASAKPVATPATGKIVIEPAAGASLYPTH